MDYSFFVLMNANIKFSLLKSLKTVFLKRSLIGCDVKLTYIQSPAVATQHLRPAGLGHVNPTTASAWPVLPALPCGEQSKHHVTRTSEDTEHMAEGRSERLHPAQIQRIGSAAPVGSTLSGRRRECSGTAR